MPILYLWTMKQSMDSSKLEYLTSFNYIKHYPYYGLLEAIVLSLAAILLLVIFYKKIMAKIRKKILLPLKIALVAVVFIDLFFVNKDVLVFRLQDISNYKILPVSTELEKKRIIALNEGTNCMETVYYKNWSTFGCSQFKDDAYHEFYKDNIRPFETGSSIDQQKLKDAGIVATVSKSGKISPISNNRLDLIKNDIDGEYIKKNEGKITMKINSLSDEIINTYLKYDPFWKVTIDNTPVEIKKNGMFFDFPLSKGEHIVKIYYYPKPFIWGILLSLTLSVILFVLYYFFKKSILEKILNSNG
jgi:hypothetical protein